MIGEQKHKIFKLHAPHTNSRGTELQLLKAVNLSQTIRFIIGGIYDNHPIAVQIHRIVSQCDVLRTQFLGAPQFTEPEPGNVTADGTGYSRLRTGIPVPRSRLPIHAFNIDKSAILGVWELAYGIQLPKGLKIKIQYWSRLTGIFDNKGHTRSVSFALDGFVSTRSGSVIQSFNLVHRILTATVGTLTKVFLLVEEVRRDTDRETISAPYDLFVLTGDAFMLPIEAVEPCNLHFVRCEEGASGWWWNNHVTSFL